MIVVDDGWFGDRNNDQTSLGDWQVNTLKFPYGLGELSSALHKLGLNLGLWFEPEMISVHSRLYTEHPDWVLQHVTGRPLSTSRNQVLYQYMVDLIELT